MSPERDRVFTKRGATIGVLAVVAATVLIVSVGAAVAALLILVF